jgi:alpha-1,6-mannosyltransferase
VPALLFVALYSNLGHKEVRFLFPVLPLFNLVSAAGMSRLHAAAFETPTPLKENPRRTPRTLVRLGYAAAIGALLVSFGASCTFVAVSRWNYPGGEALHLLMDHVQNQQQQNNSLLQSSSSLQDTIITLQVLLP